MKLLEILNLITQIARENRLSTPYICGGTPRDKYLGKLTNVSDVDITTGDTTVFKLATLVHKALPESTFKSFPDGHTEVYYLGLKFDFSSNFNYDNIDQVLKSELNLDSSTEMEKEMFSRDFTCNTLLLTMDLKQILDPTGLGVAALDQKIIDTPVNPELAFTQNINRVPRLFYMACKLNFSIDPKVLIWVKNNPQITQDIKPKYFARKLQKAADYNLEYLVKLLDYTEFWEYVPSLPILAPYLLERLAHD